MITYAETTDQIAADILEGFFQNWKTPPSKEKHLAILKNSNYLVLALDTEANKIVGNIAALSDYIQICLYPFFGSVTRIPTSRDWFTSGKNNAREIAGYSRTGIDVICDLEMQPFYARFGMIPFHGMIIRKQ